MIRDEAINNVHYGAALLLGLLELLEKLSIASYPMDILDTSSMEITTLDIAYHYVHRLGQKGPPSCL